MAPIDSHPSVADLQAFTLGTLEETASTAIEAHLTACPSCQQRAADASGDTFVELLRRVHARSGRQTETVTEAAQLSTPAPLPTEPEVVTRPPAAAPAAPAAADQAALADAVPPELARHERYHVVRLLGQGGMGAVFAAEHRVMQRLVALKVIHRVSTTNASARERFRREVRAAALLSHPNIVTTYDAEDAGDTHFLVMEYVEGISLGQLVKERGPLPVAEACAYVRQAALGLQHAHERGMVHRDVKPANLIRCADGTVKVLDFGLAALVAERSDGLSVSYLVMGTPDYMAPEQAEDARSADIRADVYSLGCTLYQLLTGSVPYPASTSMLKILAHREQQPPSIRQALPQAPPALAQVVARMLAKKPADRYQTPAEVAAALAPFTQPAARPPRQRRPVVVAIALAALLSLLTIAGGAVYRIQTDKGELVITTESDNVEVVIKKGGTLVDIIDPKTNGRITLRSGIYDLELKGAPKGLKLDIQKATLTRDGTVLAKIERVTTTASQPLLKTTTPTVEPVSAAPRPLKVERRFPWPGRNDAQTGFSADSRLCVAWSSDALRVFETETGQLVQEIIGLPPRTLTSSFLPDGKQLVSSHTDGIFRRWDVATGKRSYQFPTSPGWPLIQGVSSTGESLGVWAGQVQVWDINTGKERFHVIPQDAKGALAASAPVSPDGKRLLVLEHRSSEVGLRILEMNTGKQLLSKSLLVSADIGGWGPDNKHIYLYAGEEGQVKIARLDAETGKVISKVPLTPQPGGSYGRRFSRDARYFSVQYPAAGLVHVYDTSTGKLALTANGPNPEFSLSFAPNDRYVACGGRGEILLYRLPELSPAKDHR